jgi:hypothetical protein
LDKTVTNLDMLYETLREWRDRFPNIECITVSLFHDGYLFIHVNWKNDLHSVYELTEQEINSAYGLDAIGECILNEMERQYMLWEVGEE